MSTTWRDINPEAVIQGQAYGIWEWRVRRGFSGSSENDWLQAELQVGLFPAYVAIAAYFIWQRRQKIGTPGTPEEDWINTQKQMLWGAAKFRSSSAQRSV